MPSIDSLDILREILSCIQADGKSISHAIIEEHQEAKLKKLCISDLNSSMLLLATDEGRKREGSSACMSPLLASDGKHAQNRACDAVLLRKTDLGYQVCYIELKSDSPAGYEGQFKSTQCFIRYIAELSKHLCGHTIEINRERFVVFHTDSKNASRRGKKAKTRFSPREANTPNSPDKFCVRNGDCVRFSEFF